MKLEADQLSHAYTRARLALDDVSLMLNGGQILYLLGRNGSGKTTLLSCLSGILKPQSGQVLLDGLDIHKYPPAQRARLIGLIPQLHEPAFAYTVREMVAMGRAPHLNLFGSPRQPDYDIVEKALASVGLADFANRPYTQLSGGERQLVMIARGLAQQCKILLMDEPGAHLDPNNHQRVMEIVTQLTGDHLSFIISSHAPNNALTYADAVILLKQGKRLAFGSVLETLTETLLTEAYDVATEVIYEKINGLSIPRAILPRRADNLPYMRSFAALQNGSHQESSRDHDHA